jgi:YebC/PmpR family DNA-binding regulatory protein
MAGHSKWANIKHRKAAQDNRRAKIWTRIIKEITVAARDGGGDPDINPALRLAIQNGKGANMPKDTIVRAIKKGEGGEGANLSPQVYEGYGPNGIAIVIETLTDNINRTVANVRSIFNKYGGSLGTNGSLSFIFEQKGIFIINHNNLGELSGESFEMAIIEGGAEDVEENDDKYIITSSFEDFGAMQRTIEELGIEVESADIQRFPNNTIELDVEDAQKVLSVIEKFEEDEDVNEVYHNLELTDELQKALNEE